MNRGFGGSHMSDLLYYFDRVVAAYDPALILVYEGDNDLAGGKSVDRVYEDYLTFLARVEDQLPRADVAFIATKPSPSRSQYLEVTREFNERLEALALGDPHIWYVDVFNPMLNDSGQPRPELFGSDMLHMNAAGYALWQSIVSTTLAAWSSPAVRTFLFDFGAATTTTQFGPAPEDPCRVWNNITLEIGGSETGQLPDLVDVHSTPSDFGLQMLAPFNASGPNQNGTTESGLFAANATRDSLYGNTKTWNGFSDVAPSFKLVGLNPDRVYNFTFYASRLGVNDVRETGYTLQGENTSTVTLDSANNLDRVATAHGIMPNALGDITIQLEPTARNNNGYHFIYLGVMTMEEVPAQAPVKFTEEPVDQTVVEYRPATFRVEVDSTPPYDVQWFQDGAALVDANAFTYTIDPVTLDLDGATFSAQVSNLLYSATSTTASLTVIPDVNAPALLSARSTNGMTLELVFDERLNPHTVSQVDHYTVTDSVVIGAELDDSDTTVVLTLNERLTGTFVVKASHIQDLAGNELAPDTTASGQVQPEVLIFDFGSGSRPTAPPSGDQWNNVTDGIGRSDSGALEGLVTVDGMPTDIDLVMLSRFNGANQNGTQDSTRFPADATGDSLFGNTANFSGLSNVFPSFKLTGLDPLLTYNFTFYASRMGVGPRDIRETGYTVTGENSGFSALNPSLNIDTVVSVSGIEPDAAGDITIDLAPTEGNNNDYRFTYLGVLKVEPILE